MSRQRQKGTQYENHVRDEYLRKIWPHAQRAPLLGINDAGDFINTGSLMVEAKKRNAWRLPEWIRVIFKKSVKQQRPWILVFAGDKRKGDEAMRQDFVVMPANVAFRMLAIANEHRHQWNNDDPFVGL